MTPEEERLQSVACHEAGHVLVNYHFGKIFATVSIISENCGGEGRCIPFECDVTPRKDITPFTIKYGLANGLTLDQNAVIACAGIAAEEVMGGSVYSQTSNWLTEEDVRNHTAAYKMYCCFSLDPDEEKEKWIQIHRIEAMAILEANKIALKALSDALIDRKKLTGHEAVEILNQSFK
jgi:ATP-dependent Zn protease